MEIFQTVGIYAIIVWVVVPCTALLVLYSVIRTAVARGLRDHQKWMEKNRSLGGESLVRRESIGHYSGSSQMLAETPVSAT